jgi:hemoglobin-like flavoprotein
MMKLLVVLLSTIFALEVVSGCNSLQKYAVKSEWARATGKGIDREVFTQVFFRVFFNMAPEARALFQRVDGNNTNSPNFIAHGLRIIAAADIIIDNLDQPETLNAELAHLKKQHAPRKIPIKYFQYLGNTLQNVVPALLGERCFTSQAWLDCFQVVAAGII